MFDALTAEATRSLHALCGEKVSPEWRRPQEKAHGDLSTAVALRLAKSMGKPPREIAQELAETLQEHKDVERAEVAGAGYVNLWLQPKALLAELSASVDATQPKKARAKDAPVIVEYCSLNIAKPLGVHHILTT